MKRRTADALGAVLCAVGVTALGFVSSLFMGGLTDWYPALTKPFFTPPNWLFGPVWTVLYLMMGVALWLVVREGLAPPPAPQASWQAGGKVKLAAILFAVQLALNLAWSPVFFGARSAAGGLVVILVLWATIVATVVAFARVRPFAAWLLAPYLAWLSYATALNGAIVALN
jgi:tryptophan-rich sensory protein